SSLNPALRASAIELDPPRRPTFTLIPVPSSESRRFCACAGPCEPQPITPICLTPANAFASSGNRCRPPLTICSLRSLILTVSTEKILDEKLMWRPPVDPEDRRRRLLRKMTSQHFSVAIIAISATMGDSHGLRRVTHVSGA